MIHGDTSSNLRRTGGHELVKEFKRQHHDTGHNVHQSMIRRLKHTHTHDKSTVSCRQIITSDPQNTLYNPIHDMATSAPCFLISRKISPIQKFRAEPSCSCLPPFGPFGAKAIIGQVNLTISRTTMRSHQGQ